MNYDSFSTSLINDTCKNITDDKCFCYTKTEWPVITCHIVVAITACLAYTCWAVFALVLKCEKGKGCLGCMVKTKLQDCCSPRSQNEASYHLIDSVDDLKIGEIVIHTITILIFFFLWVHEVAYIGYKMDNDLYLHWTSYYVFTSVFSIIVLVLSLLHRGAKKTDILVVSLLLIAGFTQICANLPNVYTEMDTLVHAKRLISTEYTVFLFLNFFFAVFTWKFATKIAVAKIEPTNAPNPKFCQRLCNLLVSLKSNIQKMMRKKSDTIIYQQHGRFFKDEKICICLRMFSFAWSANLFREFANLLYDYDTFCFYDIWSYLESDDNKKLLFNSTIVLVSFCLSLYCQCDSYFVDWNILAVGFVTFFHIVYCFRISLIYQELTLLLSDFTEIFNGHLFIIAGMWFLFYLDEKALRKNSVDNTLTGDATVTVSDAVVMDSALMHHWW